MPPLQCLLIGNNQQASNMLFEHASKVSWLSFICKPINAREARHYLQEFNIDILFCDIATLTDKEMKILVQDLFDCDTPNSTANGKPTYLEFKKDELNKMFGK